MTDDELTASDLTLALMMTAAVGEAIQALGSVPSGVLYARLMGHLSHTSYESCIDLVIGCCNTLAEAETLIQDWIDLQAELNASNNGSSDR